MLYAFIGVFVVSAFTPALYRRFPHGIGWFLALVPLAFFGYLTRFLPAVLDGEPVRQAWEWVPVLALNISFYVDGLALLFGFLISGIGALVVIYSGGYLHDDPRAARFLSILLVFMGAMLGVVLADNIITLFIFWELTSFSSYLLIGHYHARPQARASALQALLVTGAGGLFLMAGLVLLGLTSGHFELSAIRESGLSLTEHPLYHAILFLVLIGAFTKSAQVPFHFWLPRAMEAPSPASAYLHSSTMVKAGIYLLARMHPTLGGTTEWQVVVTAVGALTMVVATTMALRQTVLKPLLAYTTVGALGTMTMLLGVGHSVAIKAAMAFLLAHALYKAALFLVAGVIDHETGEKDTDRLGGLRGAMPKMAIAGGLAALSMAGLPPFFGFIGKELVYEALISRSPLDLLITALTVYGSLFFLIVAFLTGVRPFFGSIKQTPKHPHDPPASMWLGPLLLGAAGLFWGLFPGLAARWIVGPAASSILDAQTTVKLYLWHGINWPLVCSVLTLLAAVAVYGTRSVILERTHGLTRLAERFGSEHGYEVLLNGLLRFARWQTGILQNGRLRYYMMVVIATTVALLGYSTIGRGQFPPFAPHHFQWYGHEIALVLITLAAIIVAMISRSRLGTIAALGVVGYAVAVIFVLFGAPDLAMTQMVVETLTLVLLVLAFYHLPPFVQLGRRRAYPRDVLFALSMGVVMTLLVLFAIDLPFHETISDYFLAHAVDGAHGRNIVNVILVDFRATDTLGEIVVLALAGVGGYALLKLRLNKGAKEDL